MAGLLGRKENNLTRKDLEQALFAYADLCREYDLMHIRMEKQLDDVEDQLEELIVHYIDLYGENDFKVVVKETMNIDLNDEGEIDLIVRNMGTDGILN